MLSLDRQWSDELAFRLVEALARNQAAQSSLECLKGCEDPSHLNSLINRLRKDSSLQKKIVTIWRKQHSDLVSESKFMSLETTTERCGWMLRRFGAENIVIELLTDPEVGWKMTEWIVNNLHRPSDREQFRAMLHELSCDRDLTVNEPTDGPRIVIFGGHVRDEQKMKDRLFANTTYDVRWKICEKKENGAPDDRELHHAMHQADAVLIVTSLISHGVMHIVKRFAQKHNIPWKTVHKATIRQLKDALDELFPDGNAFHST